MIYANINTTKYPKLMTNIRIKKYSEPMIAAMDIGVLLCPPDVYI